MRKKSPMRMTIVVCDACGKESEPYCRSGQNQVTAAGYAIVSVDCLGAITLTTGINRADVCSIECLHDLIDKLAEQSCASA